MCGRKVFYPIGWDDNGLPTERRVQNYYHVRCDPTLPYDPGFSPPASNGGEQMPTSRRNFTELCHRLTDLDEQAFEEVWRRLGLSVDWSTMYRTIDDSSRAISQRAFLRNLARGEAYLAEAPSLWDVTFQTAVAQAEVEDREVAGATHTIAFRRPDGEAVPVVTTRPELLPACVALVAHPGDERYAALTGTTVRSPLFGVEVPVLAHHLADPAKGTGIAMVCTFGDSSDVTWWRDLRLPARPVLGRDGRLLASPPPAITSRAGRIAYRQLAGDTAQAARKRIAAMLRASGDLLSGPDPVRHAVNFYEKGSQPLEIVTTRQWYIRNGAHDERLRGVLLARGGQLDWHPPHMRVRYENWVNGLAGDWLISRQRFFGVPIPVWYPLDGEGKPRYDAADPPGRWRAAGGPGGRHPAGLHRGPARPAGRVRRGSGCDGHLGHVVAEPAAGRPVDPGRRPAGPGVPDGPAAAGPRDHPDLAVLYGAARARRGGRAAVAACGDLGLGAGSGPEEDVQVGGERGHPDGLAAQVRQRRGPLLGGGRPARRGRHVRPGTAAGRPPASDQDT